ncbi:MAG TPA: hypothetical protein VLC93_14590 [Myxococcota bacterium]|nr:hypothetical protein [Myxococcota bacterium]
MTGQAIATVPSQYAKPVTPVESAPANLPVVSEGAEPPIDQWIQTVSRTTNAVLRGIADRRPDPDAVVALLRATDGASEALSRTLPSAMSAGLHAAIQTARATSIVVQTIDGQQTRRAMIDELAANITATLTEAERYNGDAQLEYLRGALRALVVPLEKLDPALAKQAQDGANKTNYYTNQTTAYLKGALGAIRSSLPTYAVTNTALVPAPPRTGLLAWLFGR